MPKAIIFDLDGLLIDSQPLQYRAYHNAFKKFGYNLTRKGWKMWIHNSLNPRTWIAREKLNIDLLKVRKEKRKIFEKLVETELKLKPGARALINKLYKKYPLAIASSSRIESILLILKKFSFTQKFKVILSDTKMKRGKPFPDIFLKAAQKLKTKPYDCVVFEDSLAGFAAAKAAGMKCIVCPDSFCPVPLTQFKKADKIIKSLKNITLSDL
ncbi:HAD family phosphatase [Candidatus Peregrinibacteria bacterium]|nr:HAD family phosphatase [Candidatus Peregrinibacteria bacterium]